MVILLLFYWCQNYFLNVTYRQGADHKKVFAVETIRCVSVRNVFVLTSPFWHYRQIPLDWLLNRFPTNQNSLCLRMTHGGDSIGRISFCASKKTKNDDYLKCKQYKRNSIRKIMITVPQLYFVVGLLKCNINTQYTGFVYESFFV